MDLKKELLLGVASLVAILLVVCFGSIGLYMRMSPAIDHVLRENDASLAATEEMLAALTRVPSSQEGESQFRDALERVRDNVTEPEEQPEIDTVVHWHDAALAGDAPAREKTVDALLRLTQINRAAMHRANEDVQRLGWAGAWATVVLCLLGFTAAIIVTRRIEHRIAYPLAELRAAASAALAGDVYRRCVRTDAQQDVRFLMETFNKLLDRYGGSPSSTEDRDQLLAWRKVVLHMLDERGEPRVILNEAGRVVAASKSALARMDGTDGAAVRAALDRALAGEEVDPVVDNVAVGAGFRACLLSDNAGAGTRP